MSVFRPGGMDVTRIFAEAIGLRAKQCVLDVGCGLGGSLRFLQKEYSIEPRGIDISPETVSRAGECYITLGDACDLPFDEKSFDAVFLECVLSLTNKPELALDEAKRVLKQGAYLAIATLSTHDCVKLTDRGRISEPLLCAELISRGFEIVFCSDEKAMLNDFIASIIFEYDSIEDYCHKANECLGGAVLSCNVPAKGTGYTLLLARHIQ